MCGQVTNTTRQGDFEVSGGAPRMSEGVLKASGGRLVGTRVSESNGWRKVNLSTWLP